MSENGKSKSGVAMPTRRMWAVTSIGSVPGVWGPAHTGLYSSREIAVLYRGIFLHHTAWHRHRAYLGGLRGSTAMPEQPPVDMTELAAAYYADGGDPDQPQYQWHSINELCVDAAPGPDSEVEYAVAFPNGDMTCLCGMAVGYSLPDFRKLQPDLWAFPVTCVSCGRVIADVTGRVSTPMTRESNWPGAFTPTSSRDSVWALTRRTGPVASTTLVVDPQRALALLAGDVRESWADHRRYIIEIHGHTVMPEEAPTDYRKVVAFYFADSGRPGDDRYQWYSLGRHRIDAPPL